MKRGTRAVKDVGSAVDGFRRQASGARRLDETAGLSASTTWCPGETPRKPEARSQPPQGAPARLATLMVITLLVAPALSACPVCWGAPDDPMVKGANMGIWVLLGIVAFVQIGFVAMFWSFWRRAREQRRFRESLHLIEGGPHA